MRKWMIGSTILLTILMVIVAIQLKPCDNDYVSSRYSYSTGARG